MEQPKSDILEALKIDSKVRRAFEEIRAATTALDMSLANAHFEEIAKAWERTEAAFLAAHDGYITLKNAWLES